MGVSGIVDCPGAVAGKIRDMRPIRWQWIIQEYKSATPAAAPSWSMWGTYHHIWDPAEVGGKAKLGTCSGLVAVYSATSMQLGFRVIDEDSNVIATGQDASQLTGWRAVALSGDATNLQDTEKMISFECQVVAGTPAAAVTYGYHLDWQDA